MADAEIIPIDVRSRTASAAPKTRCRATTSSGRACRNYAVDDSGYCRLHSQASADRSQAQTSDEAARRSVEGEGLGAFVQRRLSGNYPVDDFGYDRELSREVLMPLARPLYERYFRVRTLGMDRIPMEGPALVVANHSGTLPLDAVMLQYAIAAEHPRERVLRNIGANLVWQMPVISHLARKSGNAVANEDDALELLRRDELVGVFPEGFKGVGKGWSGRYKLQRFGRGGFIEVALRARVPIIPVAIVGAEEAYPMIGDAKLLARALGFPYFPITPTFPLFGPLGALPLPSKWIIEFGEPISVEDFPEDAAEDAMLVFDLSDTIRDTIQQMLYRLLSVRGGTFL
jgi:1-acyl-sn-glycerol-3-phosphate acyltransferase